MAEILKLKAGASISSPQKLYEGFEVRENHIIANVGIDKIQDVMQHFIVMHEEPQFFILELPTNKKDEAASGTAEALHKDIYYIDRCSHEEAITVMERVGALLFNDGLAAFGYGGHESGDEIMFGKYNVLTIYSRNIEKYGDFFKEHEIEETDRLITAWDTFSQEYPGTSEKYELDGRTVYDIPQQFEKWGMYYAERREE
jgi:hypothetical protein